MDEKINEQLKKVLNETNIKNLSLVDKVKVGCNNCGKCCCNIQAVINAFDIYNMSKVYDFKEIAHKIDMDFCENSRLPAAFLKAKPMCTFLIESNGDFTCSLGDYKPKSCITPFLSVVTDVSDLHFVHLDQEVIPLNISELIRKYSIENNELIFLEEREKICKCKEKKSITVKKYLGNRYKYDKEYIIASLISMLIERYVNTKDFFRILFLSENSILNNIHKHKDDKNMFALMHSKIMYHTYFYGLSEDPETVDFLQVSIEKFNYLQDVFYPTIRKLYQMFINIFFIDEKEMRRILDIKDDATACREFDLYYAKHVKEIAVRFTEEASKFIEFTELMEKEM